MGVSEFTGSCRGVEGSVWGGLKESAFGRGTAVGKKLCVSLLVGDQILL